MVRNSRNAVERVLKCVGALCALCVGGASGIESAFAGSTTAPGYTSGLPIYAIGPEGLLLVNQTGSTFQNPNGQEIRSNAELPFLVYQSDWDLLGGKVTLVLTPTLLETSVENGPYHLGWFNTYGGVQVNWKLAEGLFVGYRLSGYVPQGGPLALDYGTIEQRAGFTYLKDGWQATANFMYGTPIGDANDYGIVDWSITRAIGKWGVGLVGQGELDLNTVGGAPKQSEFAMGGLLSYDFGGEILQVKLTRDLEADNYADKQTVFWTNFIVPLWSPKTAAR